MPTIWFEDISIRLMEETDFAAVAEIEQQHLSAWSKSALAEELIRNDSIVLVLTNDAVVVGWLCCRYSSGEAELLKIGVLQPSRRRGYGSMLLDNLFSLLRSRGAEELFLEVRSSNQRARSFYQRRGFTDVGRRINYYRHPAEGAVVMKKTL